MVVAWRPGVVTGARVPEDEFFVSLLKRWMQHHFAVEFLVVKIEPRFGIGTVGVVWL
jgi:hypothetical protein